MLHVGSGFERKGVAVLLRAVASAPVSCHLIVLGRDKHEHTLSKACGETRIEKRVHFMGAQADPKAYYAAADAFAMASLYEPLPTPAWRLLPWDCPW
jgi:UDP-glucose:(heptosyl)LPS alpha-1,3-glucosyltransferase